MASQASIVWSVTVVILMVSYCQVCCFQCWPSCSSVTVTSASESYSTIFSQLCFQNSDAGNICELRIAASKGKVVEVYVSYLQFRCQSDNLELYDGGDRFAPFLGRPCDSKYPLRHYCSTGPDMTVLYNPNDYWYDSYDFIFYFREVSRDLAKDCYFRNLTNTSQHPHQPDIPNVPDTPADTTSGTSSSVTKPYSISSVMIGIISVSASILLICFLGICIKLIPSRSYRAEDQASRNSPGNSSSLFTIHPTSSPGTLDGSATTQGSRRPRFPSRRLSAASWWREILNFHSGDTYHSSRSLIPRSEDSSGMDFPMAPPAYDDVPPPYSVVTESGHRSREATSGGDAEPCEAPPTYSEAILLCPSPGLAGPSQPAVNSLNQV